jgi:hypothetical protein
MDELLGGCNKSVLRHYPYSCRSPPFHHLHVTRKNRYRSSSSSLEPCTPLSLVDKIQPPHFRFRCGDVGFSYSLGGKGEAMLTSTQKREAGPIGLSMHHNSFLSFP